MKDKLGPENKHCSACHAVLVCGAAKADGTCWCFDYPAIMPVGFQQNCLCADCLGKAIQEKIAEFIKTSSRQELLTMASRYRGNDKLIQGIDYVIENGRYVFTAWYHLKRGSCCGNGCKNCPY